MSKAMMIAGVLCGGLAACGVEAQSDGTAPTIDPVFDTVVDNCATHDVENADATVPLGEWGHDDYSRSANMIDNTCDCAAWQVEANAKTTADANTDHPACRPWTWFDAAITAAPGNTWVTVSSWQTTSKSECENSELDVIVEEQVGDTWIPVWPTAANHYFVFHPTFDTGTGSCGTLQIGHQLVGVGTYRTKARAIRGLDANNHGYAGVTIETAALSPPK